jgi:hypothetical protein
MVNIPFKKFIKHLSRPSFSTFAKWCGRSCVGGLFNFQLWRIYQWKKFYNLELLIDKTSSIYLYLKSKALASWIFLSFTSFLHMVFTSRNWFVMQGPVAIILISWNVIFIWEIGYWTRAMKRFALYDLLKSLYSDTNILSKYIPSLQKK